MYFHISPWIIFMTGFVSGAVLTIFIKAIFGKK